MEYLTRYKPKGQLTFKEYRKLPLEEFIANYELVLLQAVEQENMNNTFPIDENDEVSEWETAPLNYTQIEINFIQNLLEYNRKRNDILIRYFEHCQDNGKYGEEINRIAMRELLYNMNYKHNFLAKKMYHLDSSIKVEELHVKYDNLSTEELSDYSNTMGTEKIIFLHQLGILDYLKKQEPFNISTHAMAEALSAITGISTETLASYINPIFSTGADQGNNPLMREKKVKKVKDTLFKIGYKPPKRT